MDDTLNKSSMRFKWGLLTIVFGLVTYGLCWLMLLNEKSAGDDPLLRWEAGDVNGLLFLAALVALILTILSGWLFFLSFKKS
jgi:hypothetical protein